MFSHPQWIVLLLRLITEEGETSANAALQCGNYALHLQLAILLQRQHVAILSLSNYDDINWLASSTTLCRDAITSAARTEVKYSNENLFFDLISLRTQTYSDLFYCTHIEHWGAKLHTYIQPLNENKCTAWIQELFVTILWRQSLILSSYINHPQKLP